MKKIMTLVHKEILDILRDKKTLIMMVVVPLVLYPSLLIGLTLIMSNMMQSEVDAVHTAGISSEYKETAQRLEELYEEHQEDLNIELEFLTANPGEEEKVRDNADVWLEAKKKSQQSEYESLEITVFYDSSSQGADMACRAVEQLLEWYRTERVKEQLTEEGISEAILEPVTYSYEDASSLSESLGMDIGGSIGMLLIVTIMLGAVYPAIDATAGEKERGTLETLLTLPVTNFQLIMSKFLSVAVFACTTAVLSLLSLGGSVLFLIYGVAGAEMNSMAGISLASLLTMLPVLLITMIATALLISALCMCFCVFAKSFKEANNYVTPLLLVVMFASMAAMLPSISLDYGTAMIPIVNVSLMIKQVLAQQFDLMLAGATILVNLGYSVVIVWILAKMYDSEDILFSDGFRSFRIFQARSDIRPGTVPANGDMVISLTVVLLLMLYVGTAVSLRSAIAGAAVQQLIILGVPLLVVWYMKSDVKKLFSLQMPKWKKIPGSILLYIGTWLLMLVLSVALTKIFPSSADNMADTYNVLLEQPFWLVLLVMAVMPAIGEELLFRGFLFGSLRERMGSRWALLISALVFGAFHMNLVKLIPTAMLGAVFAFVVGASGSIYLSMALHFINNAISLAAMQYPELFEKVLPFLVKEQLSEMEILAMLAVGVLCTAVGLKYCGIFAKKSIVK